MKRLILLSVVLVLISCAKDYYPVRYIGEIESTSVCETNNKIKIRMKIPKNVLENYSTAAGWEKTTIYLYPDSSLIYIANSDTGHPNSKNISDLGNNVEKYRFQGIACHFGSYPILPDISKLEGQDQNSLYWKDIYCTMGVSIGYLKVPKDKKAEYDQALESLRMKICKYYEGRMLSRF